MWYWLVRTGLGGCGAGGMVQASKWPVTEREREGEGEGEGEKEGEREREGEGERERERLSGMYVWSVDEELAVYWERSMGRGVCGVNGYVCTLCLRTLCVCVCVCVCVRVHCVTIQYLQRIIFLQYNVSLQKLNSHMYMYVPVGVCSKWHSVSCCRVATKDSMIIVLFL